MKRNLYAVLLLSVLLAVVYGSGRAVSGCIGQTEQELYVAYRLAMDGHYQITITDQAGNSRQYEFTLRKGFDIRGGYLIIIPVLLLAAAGGIVLYWRRNMRVL